MKSLVTEMQRRKQKMFFLFGCGLTINEIIIKTGASRSMVELSLKAFKESGKEMDGISRFLAAFTPAIVKPKNHVLGAPLR